MLSSISVLKNLFIEGNNTKILMIPSNKVVPISEKSFKQKILDKLLSNNSSDKSKTDIIHSHTVHSPSNRLYSDTELENMKKNKTYHHSCPGRIQYVSNQNSDDNIPPVDDQNQEILYENLYCKNLCSHISKLIKKSPDIVISHDNVESIDIMNSFWGDTSDNIIPKYYLTNLKEGKILSIDFFSTIKDSIVNLRRLSPYQHEYMKNRASDEEKYEIICLYDKICNDYYDNILLTRPPSRAGLLQNM